MADFALIEAIFRAKKYHDMKLLIELVENDNCNLLSDPRAVEIIITGLRSIKKPKGRTSTLEDAENQLERAHEAWYYHGFGHPKWNTAETAKIQSACSIVAEKLFTSASSVKRAMTAHTIEGANKCPRCVWSYEQGLFDKVEKEGGNVEEFKDKYHLTEMLKFAKKYFADKAEEEGENREVFLRTHKNQILEWVDKSYGDVYPLFKIKSLIK